MRFTTLAEWLAFQEQLHPVGMDLTLERIALVADRLGLRAAGEMRTVIVAGTNGKGTVATRTAALLQAQGLQVGLFTSPHLLRYNERIRIDGEPVSDAALCRAFEAIDQARGDDSLTYFEFGALAAAWLFREQGVAVQVLEVGLGGRLDAVNIWDADVAAITAVDLDHQTWLGDNREAIGREKAGVMRAGRPVVLGELEPPASVLEHAEQLGAKALRNGHDFTLTRAGTKLQWHWQGNARVWQVEGAAARIDGAALLNTATALAAVESLGLAGGLEEAVVSQALAISAPGRLQVVHGEPEWLLDVAHNVHAVSELARWLEAHPVSGSVVALVAVMADKERAAMWPRLEGLMDGWVPVPLDLPRALKAGALADELEAAGQRPVSRVDSVVAAIDEATCCAGPRGRVVVFGSFYTVAAVLEQAPALADAALSGKAEAGRVAGEATHAV